LAEKIKAVNYINRLMSIMRLYDLDMVLARNELASRLEGTNTIADVLMVDRAS
jgi:hypothetical protein